MKSIYKYELETIGGPQIIKISSGYKILCVQSQFNKPCIWVEVDINNPEVNCCLIIITTGNTITTDDYELQGKYIGTYQIYDGNFVGHVYQL